MQADQSSYNRTHFKLSTVSTWNLSTNMEQETNQQEYCVHWQNDTIWKGKVIQETW